MILTGECALTICGDDIDFVEIDKLLGICESKKVEKNKKIAINNIVPTSIWIYTKRISKEILYEDGLKEFLYELRDKKEKIAELSMRYNVEINCYLRSEYGQFGYQLNKDVISLINEFSLPINFHILSFGQVKD